MPQLVLLLIILNDARFYPRYILTAQHGHRIAVIMNEVSE